MQEGGLTRLVLPDGTILERPAATPLERAVRQAVSVGDDDAERDEIAEEERAERDLEKQWRAYWSRATASSGADIPPFPGADQASRFFNGRA